MLDNIDFYQTHRVEVNFLYYTMDLVFLFYYNFSYTNTGMFQQELAPSLEVISAPYNSAGYLGINVGGSGQTEARYSAGTITKIR